MLELQVGDCLPTAQHHIVKRLSNVQKLKGKKVSPSYLAELERAFANDFWRTYIWVHQEEPCSEFFFLIPLKK